MKRLLLIIVVAVAGCTPAAENSDPAAKTPPATVSVQVIEKRDIAKDFTVVAVAADTDPVSMPKFARDLCGSKEFCKVHLWIDPEALPRGFPMTDREFAAEVFSFGVNRTTGFDRAVWNCKVYPQSDPTDCAAGQD